MDANNRPLHEWFNRIRTGQVLLPRFQREEAWDYDNVAGVLNSVLTEPAGLPIGSTLILEVGDRQPFVTRPIEGAPKPTERCTEHLLDGQQRLTALWKSLHGLYEDHDFFVRLNNEESVISDDEQSSQIVRQKRWLDKKDKKRKPIWADNQVDIYQRGLVPVTLLSPDSDSTKVQTWCDTACEGDLQKSRGLERQLAALRERIRHFNLPLLSLPVTTEPSTALRVFVQMNTSAVPLSAFDIVVAQFEAKNNKSMRDLVTDLQKRSKIVADYMLPELLVLQTASLRADRAPQNQTFLDLDLVKLDKDWEKIRDGIAWAAEFLDEEGVFDSSRLPTSTVIPVIAAMKEHLPDKLDGYSNAIALVRAYVWRCFCTSRYENASATRALQDYRALREVLAGKNTKADVPVFNEKDYPVPGEEELLEAGWPKRRDTLARAILVLSLKAGGHDIADGKAATRGNIKQREYHHLFPDAILTSDAGLSQSQSYRALNCALITMATNRNISAKEPIKYLKERIEKLDLGAGVIEDRLKAHVVPFAELNVGGYEKIPPSQKVEKIRSDYEAFLRARSTMVADALKALCVGLNWPQERNRTISSADN